MAIGRTVRVALLPLVLAVAGFGRTGPAEAQNTLPPLTGTWTVKEVRLGNGSTGLQLATPNQKQQLLRRIGSAYQIASTCAAGGPTLKQEREFISNADIAKATDARLKRLVALGVASRGQGIWQMSLMCGNAMASTFYWVPGGQANQIIGGRNVNDLIDYEFVLERSSADIDRGSQTTGASDLGQLSGIWVPVEVHPKGCAPSPAWIAASDQAMKIEPKAIQRFEWSCTVQSVAKSQDGSLRVGTRCGFAGQSENGVIGLSLVGGKLTLREKGGSKVYLKC